MNSNLENDEIVNQTNTPNAKAYIADVLTTLKLTEKQREELASALVMWESRVELARSSNKEALALAAQREVDTLRAKIAGLDAEIVSLKAEIDEAKRGLLTIASQKRSIDTDILQQELLIAAGRLPGDEDQVVKEQDLNDLANKASTDEALAQLKAKMGR
ncbi:MAG: chromosome partitioning protein [Treponema sp.]|jgi:phage shock protein A|nr:chromosome partitioning protein [Treponema sp.]